MTAHKPTAGEYGSAVHRLTRWRTVFTGWQLGTRAKGDPEGDAVRDHRELTILLRAEVTTLTGLLIKAGIFTAEDFDAALEQEAAMLDDDYARRFPGFTATNDGMHIDLKAAAQTMRGWKP